MMKSHDLNTTLLFICTVLLAVCTVGIFSRPTLQEIDKRMMMWGQHYGAVYSELEKQEAKKSVALEADVEQEVPE